MNYEPEFATEVKTVLCEMDAVTRNRMLRIIAALTAHGRLTQGTIERLKLTVIKPSTELIPKPIVVWVPFSKQEDTLALAYAVEIEEFKNGFVYFIALGKKAEVSVEFLKTEGYTRYQKLLLEKGE